MLSVMISDQLSVQDFDSVHHAQSLIAKYLTEDLKVKVEKMHEFTDGCAAQYKSRHCIGDLSCCVADFGFPIQRNYFETSHAKGEKDAAGSHVKQQASLAVIRGRADITNAKQLCDHLTANFSLPAVFLPFPFHCSEPEEETVLLCSSRRRRSCFSSLRRPPFQHHQGHQEVALCGHFSSATKGSCQAALLLLR